MPFIALARDYALPVLVSLLLHVAVLMLFFIRWEPQQSKSITPPKAIQATLVELQPKTQKKAASKQQTKVVDLSAQQQQREATKRKEAERARAEAKRKADAAKKAKEQQERERQEVERQRQEAEAEREKQRLSEAFQEALEQEQGALLEDEYATEAQSYIAAIARRIEDNWNRPPSARTGMQCELLIQLVPNGQVVNVDLAKGSGNAAFDRSAVQAVKKVAQFPEIKDMPIEVFERHYRRLRLVFNPQDLRL